MTKLPKHIADMVGIVDEQSDAPVIRPQKSGRVLRVGFEADGTIIIALGDTICGWINEITYVGSDSRKYRAIAANGHSGHFWTVDAAKDFLISETF